jgi:hypothetical protein
LISVEESASTPLEAEGEDWLTGLLITSFSNSFQSKAWAGRASVRPVARIIQCFMARLLEESGHSTSAA